MIEVTEAYITEQKAKSYGKPRLSDLYGMAAIFKKIFHIPGYVPVSYVCLLEHGVNFQFEHFFNRLTDSKHELIFLDNSHRVKNFTAQTGKVAYPIGPLFSQYRRLKNIEPYPDRAGTLAFPSHSSSEFDFSSGYRAYAYALRQLPAHFHPITICLYYYDVLQGHHRIFEEAGFRVITNGYIGNSGFADVLYDTMRRFRYTTSNYPGSYAYYSIEMGIPFFLYGEGIDENFLQIGSLNGIDMRQYLNNDFFKLFSQAVTVPIHEDMQITNTQRELIAYLEDSNHLLSGDSVRKLVMSRWPGLLVGKLTKIFR
ncbi:MAG: hypothetical protein J5I59_05840 [Saprospiraceae bacterium]|nr:hypothetical protein [Saprospiraceae bacterium]